MTTIQTFPSIDEIKRVSSNMPEYMRPNDLPLAVVLEGWLSDDECDHIVAAGHEIEPYHFNKCHATTREFERPLDSALDCIESAARNVNHMYWNYDLDEDPAAWMQTYVTDDNYRLHTDGVPGQMRKLTAVAMLTDPKEYVGGELRLDYVPISFIAPRGRGTIVVFPPWLAHEVGILSSGRRETINMGFFGPNFR